MNMKRMRGRNHRSSGGGGGQIRSHGGGIPLNRNHVFDSSGPDVRVRGTAQQLFERYLQLGRDATSGGDRVMAESYFQHAEHYFRILNAMTQAQQGQIQNGQPALQRRQSVHDGAGEERGGEADEVDGQLPGLGDQPGTDPAGGDDEAPPLGEPRHIPIAAAPPEV